MRGRGGRKNEDVLGWRVGGDECLFGRPPSTILSLKGILKIGLLVDIRLEENGQEDIFKHFPRHFRCIM